MAEFLPPGGFLGPTLFSGTGGNNTSDRFDIVIDVIVVPGQPIYIDLGTQHAKLGIATALVSSLVAGLVVTAGNPGDTISVATSNLILANWTAVIGAASLSIGNVYYLSVVAGQLSTVAPSVIGQCVTLVGVAVSATELKIQNEAPILL
jgi:hypothetical protein